MAIGGSVVRVGLPAEVASRKGGGKRGQVAGYSRASRLRLLTKLHEVDRSRVPVGSVGMLTLTWPKEFPDPHVAKVCLKEFLRRLRRAWGRVACFWKLEPQERGAPHFHLLPFWGVGLETDDQVERPEWEARLQWCASTWHEIAGGSDPNHLRWHLGQLGNRPCLEVVSSWERVLTYVGKYVGKAVDVDWEDEWLQGAWCWPGRFWGLQCRESLPVRVVEVEVPRAVAYQVKRVLRRYVEHQPTGRVRIGWPGGQVERRWMGRAERPDMDRLRASQVTMRVSERVDFRPLRRRVYRSREDGTAGLMAFLPDCEVRRVVRWAYELVLQKSVGGSDRELQSGQKAE